MTPSEAAVLELLEEVELLEETELLEEVELTLLVELLIWLLELPPGWELELLDGPSKPPEPPPQP